MVEQAEQKVELPSRQASETIDIDRISLFKDFDKVTSGNPERNSTSLAQTSKEPDELIIDDAFQSLGLGVRDSVANGRPGDGNRPPAGDAPNGSDSQSDVPLESRDAKDESPGPFTIVQRSENFDPKVPTAVFLDHFNETDVDLGSGNRVSHGEISRRAAEASGFNTLGLQFNADVSSRGPTDYSKALNAIEKSIDTGELPIGRGDVINISLGQTGSDEPSFEEASKFLGFEVTPENLKEQRQRVLDRMGEIANDPSRSDDDRATARRVVDTNLAISRIQARGVEIVHAAGNEGPDKFSWDFMNANWQLSSVKPSGASDPFSANHSLTTPGDGVLPVQHVNEVDLFDPTPIAMQKGHFEVAGARFKHDGRTAFLGDHKVFNRETQELGKAMPNLKQQQPQLDSSILFGEPVEPGTFQGKAEIPKFFERIQPFDPEFSFARTPGPGETVVTKVIDGTSFVNTGFLRQNFERLKALKADR